MKGEYKYIKTYTNKEGELKTYEYTKDYGYNGKKVPCECGSVITYYNMSRHKRTSKKHKKYIEKLKDEKKEILNEEK